MKQLWIKKDNNSIRIFEKDLDSYLENGWIKGRINLKARGKFKFVRVNKSCPNCKNEFVIKKRHQKFCSRVCAFNFDRSNRSKKGAQNRLENGTHNGWKNRLNKEASYPELFWMNVLKNNNLEFEHNYKINRYWGDFVFVGKKIVLEIDGKQHEYVDRKKSDIRKDKILGKLGWKIFRSKWKNPTTNENKTYIKNEIERFIEYYRGVAQ